MKCEPCNGTGLISQREVCGSCRGLGYTGEYSETVTESTPKKESVVKKIVSKFKRK